VRLAGGVVCALILLVYLGFKAFSFRPLHGDEYIYFYMSKMIAQGEALPYRDFFFAHPPFQLLLAAAVFKVLGPTFVVAKLLPIAATVVSGVLVFLVAWRRLGLFEAILAQAAFLLSYNVLRVSSHYTGGNLTLALLLAGMYLLLVRRDILAAILLALAMQTAVYAVPPVAFMLIGLLLLEPRRALTVGALAVGIYALITIVFLVIAGQGYVEGVFSYHFMKKPRAPGKQNYLSESFLFHDFCLTWSIVIAVFCLLWRRAGVSVHPPAPIQETPPTPPRKCWKTKHDRRQTDSPAGTFTRLGFYLRAFSQTRQGFVAAVLLFLLANTAWVMSLAEWYDYYFLILFPPAALLLGYSLGEFLRSAIAAARQRDGRMLARSLAVAAIFSAGYAWAKPTQYEQFYAHTPRNRPPTPHSYNWYDAPGLGPANNFYRTVFWRDQRDPRRDYPDQTYYLWHEMRHLEHLDKAVAYLRENSRPEDRLFGESATAPLFAFLADRQIVAHMADTNTKRVTSGQTSIEQILSQIDVPELRYVIASRKRQGPYQNINGLLTDWLNANFKPVYRLTSPSNPGIEWVILERNEPRER